MMMNNLANLERLNNHHNNGAKNKSTHRATLRIRNVLRAKKITLAKGGRLGQQIWFDNGQTQVIYLSVNSFSTQQEDTACNSLHSESQQRPQE